MESIKKSELRTIISWCKEKGHSADEILDLLMRMSNDSEAVIKPDVELV